MVGADIYATVRTAEEKSSLVRQCGIPDDRIYFAGTPSFADFILDSTNRLGVDVIFNSLSEAEIVRATWRCLAGFGRFVHVGSKALDFVAFEKSAIVAHVDIFALAKERPLKLKRIISDVGRLLRLGKVSPLYPILPHGISETTLALQALHSNGAHGKLVIIPRDDEVVMVSVHLNDLRLLLTKLSGTPS